MTYSKPQSSSYQTHHEGLLSEREIDARALLRCASRLIDAVRGNGSDMKFYVEAVRNNQRLWTMFQVAICRPENKLPIHLKELLINLSRYVDRVSFRAVSEYQPKLLESLISINYTIAKGLLKKPTDNSRAAMPLAQQQGYPAPAPVPGQAITIVTTA